MDLKTGKTYNSLEDALADGVSPSDVAQVECATDHAADRIAVDRCGLCGESRIAWTQHKAKAEKDHQTYTYMVRVCLSCQAVQQRIVQVLPSRKRRTGAGVMTRTYALLDVPRTVYGAIRALLIAAGYEHAFHSDAEAGEVIDMHGIALRTQGPPATAITVSSLVSRRDGQGKVEFQVNGELTQMDLDKAREVVGMLQGAIEAAVSDELITRFLTERIGLDADRVSAALLDFREMRQGSRERVHPSLIARVGGPRMTATWRRVRSGLCVVINGSHELYRVRTGTRLHQRCLLCGHETHGWDVTPLRYGHRDEQPTPFNQKNRDRYVG